MDYVVNYNINVNATKATNALTAFTTATAGLVQAQTNLKNFETALKNTFTTLSQLSAQVPKLTVDTTEINKRLDKVINKLRTIHSLANGVPGINMSNPQQRGTSTSRSGGAAVAGANSRLPSNLSYKLLGPTPLNVGGVIGVDFLKGMGIAYGIAGAGSLVRSVVQESTEYNNLMQTAKNILKTHDQDSNFGGRFAQMERIVRDVGMETKFTAPQVADAAKFLAMAGLDVDAINKSIRPIADIALVGDTELGQTADVVTNIMTGYGIAPERMRQAADIMTMTFTMSNTTLMEIAEAYKYSASLLSAAGVEFEESTAAIGVLGDAGIKGSQAGTTMRTIMANIVNPTKKQLAQWNKIGVERFDENGQVRDLVDIFKDLSEADLYVSDFYKLFHKTAAQGAVSLANNVDKWNEIIANNFLSTGVTKDLADEKKNTIAGLWAQLTSAFTDTGMEAFTSIQQPIKDFMVRITDWLKEDSTVEKFKEVAWDLMDLAHGLKDITKTFLKWAGEFKGLIKTFVEFQIKLMPVLAVLKTFKSALYVVGGIGTFAGKIALLTGKFYGLSRSLKVAIAQKKTWDFVSSRFTGGSNNFIRQNIHQGYLMTGIDPQVMARYNRIYKNRTMPVLSTQQSGGLFTRTLGAGVMTAGGAFAGNQIAKALGMETEHGKLLTTLAGGAVGLGAALIGGPIGWITGAVLAIGGIASSLYNAHKKAKEAQKSFEDFAKATRLVDGILIGENLSTMEKHLELVHNKQLSINDVISKRIELMKEELGLQDFQKTDIVHATDGQVFKKTIEKLKPLRYREYWLDSFKQLFGEDNPFTQTKNAAGVRAFDYMWIDRDGKNIQLNQDKISYDKLYAMAALYNEGLQGSASKQLKDEYLNRFALILQKGGTLSDIQEVLKEWDEKVAKLAPSTDTYPDVWNYTSEEVEKWEGTKKASSYPFLQGLYTGQAELFGEGGKIHNAAKEYFGALESHNIPAQTVLDYISAMNPTVGEWLKGYDGDLNKWAETLGYFDNTFNAKEGNDAYTVAKTTQAALNKFLEIVPKLDPDAQESIESLTGFATQLRDLAGSFITQADQKSSTGNVQEARDGETIEVSGIKYTYSADSKMWIPEQAELTPVSSQLMNTMRGEEDKKTGTRTGAPDTSDYGSTYKSTSAAPKQIIFKIENLMNVESIDMSDPNNVAVVEDIKERVAQALMDVVSDFGNNINN